jgi:DnaJ-domain-containing protein 1
MIDNFALLNQPRAPWLDEEELKKVYHALSTSLHPDRIHNLAQEEKTEAGRKFAELNGAYNCLREPKDRLRHLLQLEVGEKPTDIQTVPSDLMEWQFRLAAICRQADKALAVNMASLSPLKKVECFQAAQEQIDALSALNHEFSTHREELHNELKSMGVDWCRTGSKTDILIRLEQIYRLLGYFHRWMNQLQERITRLNLQSL